MSIDIYGLCLLVKKETEFLSKKKNFFEVTFRWRLHLSLWEIKGLNNYYHY